MAPTRIGIVDDHVITRRSLREFLEAHADLEVVGQANSGRGAIDLARQVPMDVMLLDMEMRDQSGFDSISRIMAHAPKMAVLMLSGYPSIHYGVAMMKKGARGYLNKQCEPSEIVSAIRTVASGKQYVNQEMGTLLFDDLSSVRAPHLRLTDREFQVMIKLARGRTPAEVGSELSLSEKTVCSYRVKIVDKLGVHSNGDLMYYALKHGLID